MQRSSGENRGKALSAAAGFQKLPSRQLTRDKLRYSGKTIAPREELVKSEEIKDSGGVSPEYQS